MSSLTAFVSLPRPYQFGSTAQTPAEPFLIAANERGKHRCLLEDERHLSASETLFAQKSLLSLAAQDSPLFSSILWVMLSRRPFLSPLGSLFRQLEHLSLQSIRQCIRSKHIMCLPLLEKAPCRRC